MANTFVVLLVSPSLLATGPDDDRLRLLELGNRSVVEAEMGLNELRWGQGEPLEVPSVYEKNQTDENLRCSS